MFGGESSVLFGICCLRSWSILKLGCPPFQHLQISVENGCGKGPGQLHLSENQVFDATLFAQVQRETLKRVEDFIPQEAANVRCLRLPSRDNESIQKCGSSYPSIMAFSLVIDKSDKSPRFIRNSNDSGSEVLWAFAKQGSFWWDWWLVSASLNIGYSAIPLSCG